MYLIILIHLVRPKSKILIVLKYAYIQNVYLDVSIVGHIYLNILRMQVHYRNNIK